VPLEQYQTQITTDSADRGQLIETDAAMDSLERKIDETAAQFVADQSQKLAAVEQKRDHLEQDLIKAASKAGHAELRAPTDGTVQQLGVHTLGQVVSAPATSGWPSSPAPVGGLSVETTRTSIFGTSDIRGAW